MILTSVPVYLVTIAWKNKPKAIRNTISEFSNLLEFAKKAAFRA